MSERAQLRILIADEKVEHLHLLADVLTVLGHTVVAREVIVSDVAAATKRTQPDVAIVGLGNSTQHGLDMIGEIVHEASCPVIAVLAVQNEDHLQEAARRGIFASVFHEDPEELRSAIEIALLRFADYHNLQEAFTRRASIEQAKGILMSRDNVTAEQAFAHLRDHSGRTGAGLVDVAAAVIQSHGVLLPGASELIVPALAAVD